MNQKISQQVLQLNHARRVLTKAENLIDVADKYNSDIQGAMDILAKQLPAGIRRQAFKKVGVKNIAGKWIIVNRYNHWNFITLNRSAKIIRQISKLLNRKSKILSDQM